MNTDCTKPSVAPKPRFVCHASLNLPTPLMTANRGPKPSLAPKPRVIPELNGNQDRCINGGPLTSDGEVEEEHEIESSFDKMVAERVPAEAQLNDDTLKASLKDGRNVIHGTDDRNVTEEEREEEEDMIQKMDEDWRLTDSALTDNVDSLETLWVSDAGLPADSEESVEMADTTEEMDAEGCDAGEALADTDGLSMGDICVSDEMAGCRFAEKQYKNGQNKLQIKADEVGDCTADDFSESLTDEPGLTNTHFILTDRPDTDEESAADCGHMCNKLKVSCETTGKGKTLENIHCYDPKHQKCSDDPAHEPYYVSSDDVINIEIMSRDNTESPLRPQKVPSLNRWEEAARQCEELTDNGKSSEQYMEINKNGSNFSKSDTNKVGPYQKWVTVQTEELCPQTAAVLLNRLDCQPRVRVVSISVPVDADTSLTSSVSESQLFSPNNSDISDLEGHIMPFLDDTTDTEQDISDDHIYEEPSLEGQGVFPFDKRSREIHSCSLSQHLNNNVAEVGSQFSQRPYMSGYEQPSLSSTPILTSKQRNYAKPLYLSRYPRSISVEGQDTSVGVYSYMEGSPKQGGAICLPGSFSRCSPLSSSGLSTPTSVVDIPPPFELAYITKRPITKSSPSLFTEEDSSAKNRKKKSSIKRFLMLKFRRKTDSKSMVDVNASSFKSSAESVHRTPSRLLDPDRQNINNSPQLNSRSAKPRVSLALSSKFLLYDDIKSKGSSAAVLNRSIIRVESFEDRSRAPFTPLPLIKPRSISFPNTDTSDYENVPPLSSDYENVQVPQRRPVLQVPFTDFFDRPSRLLSSTNETDGYVDMSSLPGFKGKTQSPDQETESAYTEPYKVCLVAAAPQATSAGEVRGEMAGEEDQGCTSEEEEGGVSSNYERQPDGRSRAFYIAKELVDTEREHVKALKLLQEDFREAVGAGVGDEGEPVLDEERLREILNELPDVYTLHRRILNELENRIRHWDENQRIADVFLSRKAEFLVFTTYIGHYDRSVSLLEDSRRTSPAFAAIVHQFEQIENVPLKHQLLQVIVRIAQYRMFLTDYLNNLSPDSREYEDSQAAVAAVSDIAEQVNDSLEHGENLLRLVNIEYSVHGQRDLLQPGRVFVKEGTLMKVSRKSRQPRHLFLMNDVLLYTFPQQDGKYRLKNSFPLTGLKVSKPIIENVQNALKIEGTDISITLSASSFIEREDWFYTLSRTVTEHTQGSGAFNSCSGEPRDHLHFSLGEKAPKLVPVSQVMMCMNCTSDFSLTLRRHHCHGCGRIVCRSCSRNRYPLKYMKDRMAKVCDHCYNELTKRGGDVPALSSQSSPHQRRSNRPLSAVFQNIHPPNIWRHRKGTLSFTQVTISEEGSISGSLHRSKKSKKSWKRLWFLLKDKVLYTYRGQEEKVASETLPLLGFTVKLPDRLEGEEGKEDNIFQLYHKKTLYYTFKAADNNTAQRWVNAMEEATVL